MLASNNVGLLYYGWLYGQTGHTAKRDSLVQQANIKAFFVVCLQLACSPSNSLPLDYLMLLEVLVPGPLLSLCHSACFK